MTQTRLLPIKIVAAAVATPLLFLFADIHPLHAQTATGPAVFSGLFGARDLDVETPNNPGESYEMVLHINEFDWYQDELAYNADRGWGFERQFEDPLDSIWGDRNGSGNLGPFDDSPNNRDNFPLDTMYNSFIGFKSHLDNCDAFLFDPEDRNAPCRQELDPSGGVFRVDVPNGRYRFVGVFGDSQHNHAHRVVVEDGGASGTLELGDNHAVLVGNHNTPDYVPFVLSEDYPGSDITVGRDSDEGGNLALVGFEGSMPPAPEGEFDEQPLFVMYDENGEPMLNDDGGPLLLGEATPNSPTLEVTQGYIRLHLLQGNSNDFEDEDGNLYPRDANGSDVILFEAIPVGSVVEGDYNGNGELDAGDLDVHAQFIKDNDLTGDVNGDGVTDVADRSAWTETLQNSYLGDANFDGEFNSSDFVAVFTAGKYETGEMATYAEGDWNGDMMFNSGDFVAAFSDGGYEQGPRAGVAAVPEPSSLVLLGIGMLLLSRRRRA